MISYNSKHKIKKTKNKKNYIGGVYFSPKNAVKKFNTSRSPYDLHRTPTSYKTSKYSINKKKNNQYFTKKSLYNQYYSPSHSTSTYSKPTYSPHTPSIIKKPTHSPSILKKPTHSQSIPKKQTLSYKNQIKLEKQFKNKYNKKVLNEKLKNEYHIPDKSSNMVTYANDLIFTHPDPVVKNKNEAIIVFCFSKLGWVLDGKNNNKSEDLQTEILHLFSNSDIDTQIVCSKLSKQSINVLYIKGDKRLLQKSLVKMNLILKWNSLLFNIEDNKLINPFVRVWYIEKFLNQDNSIFMKIKNLIKKKSEDKKIKNYLEGNGIYNQHSLFEDNKKEPVILVLGVNELVINKLFY
jgi:hypothetical protein